MSFVKLATFDLLIMEIPVCTILMNMFGKKTLARTRRPDYKNRNVVVYKTS